MIASVVLSVTEQSKHDEEAFWRCFGYRSLIGTRSSPGRSKWLASTRGSPRHHLWLMPVETSDELTTVRFGLIAERPLEDCLNALDRLGWAVPGKILDPWWGARRALIASPSGHLVDLIEFEPKAFRYGPPDENEVQLLEARFR
jgi:hypothetical protein